MRSMVEGHRRVLLTFWRSDTLNVPLHPSLRERSRCCSATPTAPPCRGGIQPRLCLNLSIDQTPLTPFRGRGAGGEGARAMRRKRRTMDGVLG